MRNFLLKSIFVVTIACFLSACSNDGKKTYHNKKYDYSFEYPSDWTEDDSSTQVQGTIVQLYEPETEAVFRPNINLVITDLSKDERALTKDELDEYTSDEYKKMFDIVSEHNFNGKHMFVVNSNGYRVYQVFTVKDSKAFWLTLTSIDDNGTNAQYEKIFEEAMSSIKM